MKRIVAVLTFVLGVMFIAPSSSFAHAQLVSATPAIGSNLHTAPREVQLAFDGDLIDLDSDNRNVIAVTNSDGHRFDSGPTVLNGSTLTVALLPISDPGTYTVTYLVISEDGHPVENSYQWILLPNESDSTNHGNEPEKSTSGSNGKDETSTANAGDGKGTLAGGTVEKPVTTTQKGESQSNALWLLWASAAGVVAVFSAWLLGSRLRRKR
jgi:methionine-rich copper-binding protein CopC